MRKSETGKEPNQQIKNKSKNNAKPEVVNLQIIKVSVRVKHNLKWNKTHALRRKPIKNLPFKRIERRTVQIKTKIEPTQTRTITMNPTKKQLRVFYEKLI